MAILEEFKRQLVQDLAKCMVEDHEPRDQMWSRLNKEYGCDCNLLWERIRTLTMKKLMKMLATEDRLENITRIARMTPTDWLVFDKILVHENIDVIGQELILSGKPESKVLWELFILVSSYHIETLPPRDLVKGWFNLTKTYNTSGRYCSPMLLQLRWYQLKKLVRENFIRDKFWATCRRNDKYLSETPKPTKLQRMIADRYSNLITEPFTTWEYLVKKRLVVQASDLENYRQMDQSEQIDNDDAELIEIKPYIETIDLNTDSDSDDLESRNKSSSKIIKSEKIHIRDIFDAVSELESEKTVGIKEHAIQYGKNNEFSVSTSNTTKLVFPKIVSVEGNVNNLQSHLVINKNQQYQLLPNDVDVKNPLNNSFNKISNESSEFSGTMKVEMEERRNCLYKNVNISEKLPIGFKFIDDGIDLESSHKETVDQHKQEETEKGNKINVVKRENHSLEENDSTGFIDPKLLMFPITYTKKLDDMDIFKNTYYFEVKGNHFIEYIEAESKPSRMKDIKKEEIDKAVSNDYPIKREVSQLKYTITMCQKPKYRIYNPIELHKNPDFNVQLKRLPINFLSNERNRRLFNACTPVTIDIDRVLEKLVYNDLHLENTINPIIKQEKKNYECKNTVWDMPSDDSQETVEDDKNIVNIKELLPLNESDISETSLNSGVSIRNSANFIENFLTIEISPLDVQHSDFSTKPPVKLVQLPSGTFQENSTTSHNNSIIQQVEKSGECMKTVSVITSTEERLVDKSTLLHVKEFLPQQNETDMPGTPLKSSIIDGSITSYTKNLLAIEVSPIYVNDTVSNISPPVKLFQCPTHTFKRNSTMSPTSSTVIQEKQSEECDNVVSFIPSTGESILDKNIMAVNELLPHQNERDIPEMSLNNSLIGKSNESINQNVLTIEICPLIVNDTVSNINPPVKLVQYPGDTFKKKSILEESKLDSKEDLISKSGLKTNNMPTSKNFTRLSQRNLCVPQQAHEFLITKKTVNKVLNFLNDQSFEKAKTTQLTEPDAFTIKKNTALKVIDDKQSFEKIKNTHATDSLKEVQQKSTHLLLTNNTNNQSKENSEEKSAYLAHYDECKNKTIKNDEIIDNSAMHYRSLPYRNVKRDAECVSIITETDNQSSLSILPRRLSNDATCGASYRLILTREDQGEREINEQNRTTHARFEPLVITKISSEPTHVYSLPPTPLNIPPNICLKSYDVRTSNNFESKKTNIIESKKTQNLSKKSNDIVNISQLNSSDYEPLIKKSRTK